MKKRIPLTPALRRLLLARARRKHSNAELEAMLNREMPVPEDENLIGEYINELLR